MTAATNPISAHLRSRKPSISQVWEATVRAEIPELSQLDRAALVDHLPEFLEGLARWVEGDTRAARSGFAALADGHAVQRLGHGVELVTLTREYILMRSTILRELLAVGSSEPLRELMVRVNEGIDEAIHGAVRRYSMGRDEIRDRFVAILGHDLRNPLQGILMAGTRVLAGAGTDARLARLGAIITRSAERMGRMIQDVIELARAQLGGGVHTVLGEADLGELCQEVVDELALGYPDRTIELAREGDLRGVWDRDRVMQALSNLAANALEHGEDPITMRVYETEDRQAVVTRVHNRGTAIPVAQLPTVFEPLVGTTGPGHRGLGLGLYIVREIALAHGARCEVASTPAEGTTFSITWPRTPLEQGPART